VSHRVPLRSAVRTIALAAAVLLVVGVGVAFAHTALRRSEPPRAARLDTAPREIRLVFTEGVALAVSKIVLLGPDSAEVALSAVRHPGDSTSVLVAGITGSLRAGQHTVLWQTASDDGHGVRGSYAFTILDGAAGLAAPVAASLQDTTSPPPTRSAPREGAGPGFAPDAPLYDAIRWLEYIGLVGLLGVVAFRVIVVPIAQRSLDATVHPALAPLLTRVASAGVLLGVLLVVAIIARLGAQAASLSIDATMHASEMRGVLLGTTWGTAWILQIAGAVLALAGLARGQATDRGWRPAALGVALVTCAEPWMGHAAAMEGGRGTAMLADALHLFAAGGWLGTLLVIAIAAIPYARRLGAQGAVILAALVHAFSPVALGSAAVLVVTGIVASWLHLNSLRDFVISDYGAMLLRKLVVLAVILAIGAYNWRRVRPSLMSDAAAVARLRRSATAELVLAAVLLAVTAVLVALPAPAQLPLP
jgi:putative copper export protein/methionine-rich copper-binding protein CopC